MIVIFPESPQTFAWEGSQNYSYAESQPLSNSGPSGNFQKWNPDPRTIFELIPGGYRGYVPSENWLTHNCSKFFIVLETLSVPVSF